MGALPATENLHSKKGRTHNLQLDRLPFQLNGADLEVDTNSTDVALGVGVVSETQQQAGLGERQRIQGITRRKNAPCRHQSLR